MIELVGCDGFQSMPLPSSCKGQVDWLGPLAVTLSFELDLATSKTAGMSQR